MKNCRLYTDACHGLLVLQTMQESKPGWPRHLVYCDTDHASRPSDGYRVQLHRFDLVLVEFYPTGCQVWYELFLETVRKKQLPTSSLHIHVLRLWIKSLQLAFHSCFRAFSAEAFIISIYHLLVCFEQNWKKLSETFSRVTHKPPARCCGTACDVNFNSWSCLLFNPSVIKDLQKQSVIAMFRSQYVCISSCQG